MKPKHLKNLLLSEIDAVSQRVEDFFFEAGKYFTRNRKLPLEKVIKTIVGMESKSITNEHTTTWRTFRKKAGTF